jgi:hypothetical protein
MVSGHSHSIVQKTRKGLFLFENLVTPLHFSRYPYRQKFGLLISLGKFWPRSKTPIALNRQELPLLQLFSLSPTVKSKTVKSPNTSFTSNISATPCEGAMPSPNFRYRQRPLTRKIAAPEKLENGGRCRRHRPHRNPAKDADLPQSCNNIAQKMNLESDASRKVPAHAYPALVRSRSTAHG